MKILGVDPGTATTGFGVIEKQGGTVRFIDAGVITTLPSMAMPNRLAVIYTELGQLLAQHNPDVVAVELLFFASNVTTAIAVGQARGVVLLTTAEAGCEMAEYTPLQVKQALTGYGGATKQQIQEMVRIMLKLSAVPRPDDAADGLAIAITHANQLTNRSAAPSRLESLIAVESKSLKSTQDNKKRILK